ncbi:MAG: hypothetical protein COB69_06325, partial [Phycisphaera sp.]
MRTYLESPQTPCTEAITAMGSICPFFERAGMTKINIEPMQRDTRLQSKLEELAHTPCDLLTDPLLRTAMETRLRIWARQNASTRPIATGPIEPIARAAAARLIA